MIDKYLINKLADFRMEIKSANFSDSKIKEIIKLIDKIGFLLNDN